MAQSKNPNKAIKRFSLIKEEPVSSKDVGEELNVSQEQTAVPTLKLSAYVRDSDIISFRSMEFHMTIRPKVTELSPKQASMLLSIANWRAVHSGVDFTLYLAMEFLYNSLWKNGRDPLETKNEKVRQTLLVTDIIFSYIRGKWLTFKDKEDLPIAIVQEVETLGWLPNERTMQSWQQHWILERYLEVKIVPVEALINRNKFNAAERYTSYTKGYGNDGSPAKTQRTKPSPELDGDDSEILPPHLSLQEFEEYQTAIRLIEYAKARRIQRKD